MSWRIGLGMVNFYFWFRGNCMSLLRIYQVVMWRFFKRFSKVISENDIIIYV